MRPLLLLLMAAALVGTAAPLGAGVPVVHTPAFPEYGQTTRAYLPEGDYADSPEPIETLLGWLPGDRHVTPEALVAYGNRLAASPRVRVEQVGTSHGGRPLQQWVISHPDNLKQLDGILSRRRALADPRHKMAIDPAELPAVTYLGYGVHGNEPSGSNAAPIVAWYLATATAQDVEALLRDIVVVIDPALNPDGIARFAAWSNNHRGRVPNADPAHREHDERFPEGRTNYYGFDLNRDWMPLQHPETRARMAQFYRFRPNTLFDVHEMGTDRTYFFQPGIPARNHPLTPESVYAFTREIAGDLAQAFDDAGALYFTEERFDDFYMGKASTLPDLHGTIGMLFEQASARGIVQESINGPLTLADAIRNQVRASLTAIQATADRRTPLNEHLQTFYREALDAGLEDPDGAFLFHAPDDPVRAGELVRILEAHQIRVHRLAQPVTIGGTTFPAHHGFIVPLAQPEYRYIRALFETRTTFEENIFYDVSTWTLPLAFGCRTASLGRKPDGALLGPRPGREMTTAQWHTLPEDALAFAIHPGAASVYNVLYDLLEADVRIRIAGTPFTGKTDSGTVDLPYGTAVITLGPQPAKRDTVRKRLEAAINREGLAVHALTSGLTPQGIDLGSPSFRILEKPEVLLVVGESTDVYNTAEVWHGLDTRVGMPVTQVDADRIGRTDLDRYTVIVLAGGSYRTLPERGIQHLKTWAGDGGTLIAIENAVRWAKDAGLVDFKERTPEPAAPQKSTTAERLTGFPERLPYDRAWRERAYRLVRGAIFEASLDRSHPLAFGYADDRLPVFRTQTFIFGTPANPYATPVAYTDDPLLSGYVSAENLEALRGAPSVLVERIGRGRAILFADNPQFRAFWWGTQRLFFNAVFLGPQITVPRD
ncbi:MAG: M14 family zinc carboxypeptidase [Opitutales bacterium]